MTSKQALARAIAMMMKKGSCAEEVRLLQEISNELPRIHWSDSSIRETVEQFILDNGRTPTASDFKKAGMPPHTVIQNKYKMTLSEWLEQNYPVYRPSYEELKEEYTAAFIEDYFRIKPQSQYEFNKHKRPETRGWQTVATYHHTKSWRKLLKALNLPLYFDMARDHQPVHFRVNIQVDYDFRE